MTLTLCTLYQGLPHGLAIIESTNPNDEGSSFKGVGMFNHGKLQSGPFTWVNGWGEGQTFTNMHNGRPANNCSYTYFHENGYKQYVDSKEIKSDVSGWQYYTVQIDKERRENGLAKYWEGDGSIFIGQY